MRDVRAISHNATLAVPKHAVFDTLKSPEPPPRSIALARSVSIAVC